MELPEGVEPPEPLDARVLVASPPTATALPAVVTGALTGADGWFPPATDREPVVDEPAVEGPGGVEPPEPLDARVLVASPPTATALPAAVTGALTGADAWFPPATDREPVVDEPAVEGPEGVEPPEPLDARVLVASPPTATALPAAVTGALTGADAWFPPPAEPAPVVVLRDAWVDGEDCCGAVVPDDRESPRTATVLPVAVTGAATATVAWLPPRALAAPVVVSSAEAWPAMNRTPPPARRATWSPRRTYACMVFPP
nr:hypothetical protein [Pedococcus sp. 5OH_020]